MSSSVDLILLAALVVTSASVTVIYFRLRRLMRALGDYRSVLESTAAALEVAHAAVAALNTDARDLVVMLAARIGEAQDTIGELRYEFAAREASGGQPVVRLRARPDAAPIPDFPTQS